MPKLMNSLMGTKFQVIAGYKGTGPIRVALQRREIEGLCSGWESMRATARSLLDAKGPDKLIPFLVHGKLEDPELQGVPQYLDAIKGDENKAAWKAWVNQFEFQRPLMVPPKTPKERLEILRAAMQKTLTDKEFLAEAKKSKMLVDNVTGEVQGACLGWESMSVSNRAMLDAKGPDRRIPFLIHKKVEDPDVSGLPLFTDVIAGEDNLVTYRTWAASYEFQRPFSLPPGTPSDRLAILRKAFAATLRDSDFLADAKKTKLFIEPVAGEDIDKHVNQIYSMSSKVKRNLSFLVRSTVRRSN